MKNYREKGRERGALHIDAHPAPMRASLHVVGVLGNGRTSEHWSGQRPVQLFFVKDSTIIYC